MDAFFSGLKISKPNLKSNVLVNPSINKTNTDRTPTCYPSNVFATKKAESVVQ